ncbi:MAG: hypothetical protein OXG72_00120 [Acidobacteria bacterium]|nr:hypothetical protein [Acidobacteriota bacterium]
MANADMTTAATIKEWIDSEWNTPPGVAAIIERFGDVQGVSRYGNDCMIHFVDGSCLARKDRNWMVAKYIRSVA